MEYISDPGEKIPALAGFQPPPIKAKISKAHALPSELASLDWINQLKVIKKLFLYKTR